MAIPRDGATPCHKTPSKSTIRSTSYIWSCDEGRTGDDRGM